MVANGPNAHPSYPFARILFVEIFCRFIAFPFHVVFFSFTFLAFIFYTLGRKDCYNYFMKCIKHLNDLFVGLDFLLKGI